MKKYAIGADIGGGHITTALIDLTAAEIVRDSDFRLKVDALGSAESILSAWTEAIAKIVQIAEEKGIDPELIKGIGLAMPGPFDYPNGICLIEEQEKFRSLFKMSVRQELAGRTHFKPENIRFKNDAECFLLGEVFGGAGKGSKRAIGITLGTGFGSAYYFDGVSEDANLWCAPFKGETAEYYISTSWFIRRYEELTGTKIYEVKDLVDGVVNSTDAKAKQVFDEFGESLHDFLVPLAKEQKADTILMGGNIALSEHLFTGLLRKDLNELNPPVRVVITALGEEAALMGSASLLND
ncbi:ROK family protein [Viscerimonas tarda]